MFDKYMLLHGKVALVTGAASGIGKAAAKLMAQAGAKVGLLDISDQGLRRAAEEISNLGGECIPLIADVSDAGQMEASIEKLISQWDRLDIVFANAGINGVFAPIDQLDPEEWSKTISINLSGTFLTVKYAVPYLKKRGGSIVVTSSINGNRKFSNTGGAAYSSTKAAQTAFTKMIALELAQNGIRANAICPGSIETQIGESTQKRGIEEIEEPVQYPEGAVPLTDGNPGKPEQVAQLVLFLASDLSNHITGTEVYIDGGQSLLEG